MPWFQGSDDFPVHPKTKRALVSALDGNKNGVGAIGLWFMAGCQVQRDGRVAASVTGDGVIERVECVRMLMNAPMVDELAQVLIDVGFWHAPGHSCDRCPVVAPGTWYFHDWRDMKYTPGDTLALMEAKRNELKDDVIVAEVWARDCIDPSNTYRGLCRYCGNEVKRKDTKSIRKPELDHVDPAKAIGARNIVLSCNTCNRQKGSRLPEEAGLVLRPQPEHSRQLTTTDATDSAGPASPRDDAGRPATGSSRRPTPPPHAEASRPADTTPPVPDATPSRELTGDEQGPNRPAAPAVDQPAATHHAQRPGIAPSEPPPDHGPITPDQSPDHTDRAVPGGRAPGQGQGQGCGVGKGTGVSQGSPQPPTSGESRSKRRRRRRRGRSPNQRDNPPKPSTPDVTPIDPPQPDPHDAGAPPDGVQLTEGFGSPYFKWRGPPSTVGPETDCTIHHLPMPCWRCDSEANP